MMTSFENALYARGYRFLCGIDEAGRGALAGPVVAAAVILPEGCLIEGLRDSKKLSPKRREFFLNQIQSVARAIGVGVVDNETVDRINILQATLIAMRKGFDALSVKPDYLLIDALTLPKIGIPQQGIIHGDDRSQSIAAASVVAKVTRDRLMCEYHTSYPMYALDRHKGYGTREHLLRIKEFGPCPLHRKTFRGVI
ncbi:MAG: ribonuclease HII [Nitrospiria bacterium]